MKHERVVEQQGGGWDERLRTFIGFLVVLDMVCLALWLGAHWVAALEIFEGVTLALGAIIGVWLYFVFHGSRHRKKMQELEHREYKARIHHQETITRLLNDAHARQVNYRTTTEGNLEVIHKFPPVKVTEVKQEAIQPQIAAPPLVLPEKVLMLDVMRRFDLRPDNLFLALGKGRQEVTCSLEGLMHVAHDAPTGQGKTAQFYAEMIMLLKLDVRVILANPHFAPIGKKGDDWRPIAKAIEAQGRIEISPGVLVPGLIRKYENIKNMLEWLSTVEIDRRYDMQAEGDYSYQPIYLFIDEWPAVVRRFPEAAGFLVDVLQRGRAVEVCVDTNAQGYLTEDTELKGSARENYNTAFHMGGSVYSGSKLLDMTVKDMNALLKTEQVTLGKGVALLRNNEAVPQAQLVRLPYAENAYCYYMLGRADTWQLPEVRATGTARGTVTGTLASEEQVRNTEERLADTPGYGVPAVPQGTPFKRANVSDQEREHIKNLARQGVPRREMCAKLGKGKHYYDVIRQVLDEEGL